MEAVTIQDLIDYHLKGAAAMPDKGNANTYRARAEWHKAAAKLLQSVPTTVDLANADADGFRNGRASVVVELPKAQSEDGDSWSPIWSSCLEQCRAAIIAAGGSVKE